MVLSNIATNGEELVADAHLLQATAVGQKVGDAIKKYLVSYVKPTTKIMFVGTKVGIHTKEFFFIKNSQKKCEKIKLVTSLNL